MANEDFLADRVDSEPLIFRGCTNSELVTLLIVSTIVWLPVSILVAVLIGRPALFLGILAATLLELAANDAHVENPVNAIPA